MAKAKTIISLDPALKKDCQELFADLGMDLSTAITIFLKQCVRIQGIPFDIGREVPYDDAAAAAEEYRDIVEHPEKYRVYGSVDEAFADALSGQET